MSNLTIDEENPLQMFLYGLRAPESKRQYPRRLKVFLDYLSTKGELMTDILEYQCKDFILKTKENPKWANNQLMEFVLFQKNRVEKCEIVSATIRNYLKATKLFLEMNPEGFDIGIDTGTPVTDEYKPGARFTSKIEKVMIDLFGERHIDHEAETKAILKSQ